MDNYDLDTILNNDPLDILQYTTRDTVRNNDQRLIDSFLEINEFFRKNNRSPVKSNELQERELYARLEGIKENPQKVSALKKYDRYNLLSRTEEQENIDVKEVTSIDDILENDELGLLNEEGTDIFTLNNIPEIKKDRADADFVAKRKECKDFEKYEPIFKQCQIDLKEGKRKLISSVESKLKPGCFCVLDGVLLYMVNVYEGYRGNSEKINRRTKIVFENGTESNMLLRSLGKRLKNVGKMITPLDTDANLAKEILEDDIENGYIYILKSLSNDDRISTKRNLYKIGFSKGEIAERIKNAQKDPTYLMAPVEVVSSFKVYNMNPQKLEQLTHRFFGNSCLNVDIVDGNGDVHSPREWFIAPLGIIELVVEMIVNGSIVNYEYDTEKEKIVMK